MHGVWAEGWTACGNLGLEAGLRTQRDTLRFFGSILRPIFPSVMDDLLDIPTVQRMGLADAASFIDIRLELLGLGSLRIRLHC